MSDVERISGQSVYPYANELIVELTGVDEDGDFVVLSYQFSVADGDTVSPKQPVEPRHTDVVRTALDEAGHEWVAPDQSG